ncbi:hypothetical protein DPMN_086053 [Dreissena polymorpha]|uniref:Uncharacterized protein n=1 Tax=Dreissena polymorpha TaxID=45954 RepID=A0A9D4BDD4_DREPO|nr:hypothetical protein DPMN_086053 [Dreissena polymorpha]
MNERDRHFRRLFKVYFMRKWYCHYVVTAQASFKDGLPDFVIGRHQTLSRKSYH